MDKYKYWYIEIYSLLVQEASICEVSDRGKNQDVKLQKENSEKGSEGGPGATPDFRRQRTTQHA